MDAGCFHCGDPLPPGDDIVARVGGKAEPVCCHGCRAVAEFIDANGLASFYAHRDAPPADVELRPEASPAYAVFDDPALLGRYVRVRAGSAEAVLDIGGMYCSACAWLLDRTLGGLEAVRRVDVNPATRRAVVHWDIERLPFSALLGAIARAGFRPQPAGSAEADDAAEAEYRGALRRLIVAAAAGMQVMMFAIALYAGEHFGIDGAIERFLRTISLLVCLPIVFYSARPFFAGAWRGLKAGAPGMDLPVALALAIAFTASVRAVWLDSGAIYFDSVAMFVLFLGGTRFLEMRARHRAGDQSLALARLLPDVCTRIDADGGAGLVPVVRLAVGDRVRVRPGDLVPVDGVVEEGGLRVDEAHLTGESEPLSRQAGSTVFAGSRSVAGRAVVRVTRVGNDTSVAEIGRLLERAKADRPAVAVFADRLARHFTLGVLLVATLTGGAWLLVDPSRAIEVVLATLVVTCPCALALATPAALAAAGSALARRGSFLVRAKILERLRPGATVVFDKTGTLTAGRPAVVATRRFAAAGELSDDDCRRIAAALEADSEHVLARAFVADAATPRAGELEVVTGQGVAGCIDGRRYRLGRADWVAGLAGPLPAGARHAGGTEAWLGTEDGFVAAFELADALREDAAEAVQRLAAAGCELRIASGDRAAAVAPVAARLGIASFRAALSPADKLAYVRELRAGGRTVVMVGDGVNDAPVLEAADASIAMDAGTALARASADAIALGRRLVSVAELAELAGSTRRVIRQNVAWAIGYNLTAVPLAASGLLAPWMAALGMSLSSFVVVVNALRIGRRPRRRQPVGTAVAGVQPA